MRLSRALPAVAMILAACGGPTRTPDDGRLEVVTTVAPITNLVENVGGPHVRVTGLVPEGTNSHTFEPAPSDARILSTADLFIANGLQLELPSIRLAEKNLPADAISVELAAETITPDEAIFDFSFPVEDGDPNPHLWTHPQYAKRFVEIIEETLSARDPEHVAEYATNAAALAARFDALDAALRTATATVPEANRRLLTYHDSFPYMAREYGWTIIGAIQPSDFSDPTPREVADLIRQIRELELPAIFGSEVFASPVLEQIARETGAAYIADLRDDDLPGEHGEDDHSLLGLLVFDFETIVTALGGDARAFEAIDTSNLHPVDDLAVTYRS